MTATVTLQQLNDAAHDQAKAMLDGLYEHSPWIAEQALSSRPFRSLAHVKHTMATVLAAAGRERQLALVRAHPELAGKAMRDKQLTAASTNEQNGAGLTQCTPEELAQITRLNADYASRFGHPFILAVRGPRGDGLSKQEILATFERRLHHHPEVELQECLRNIHRIVELRLNDKFGVTPALGNLVWDWHESLSRFSDPGFAEKGQLTVTYLTDFATPIRLNFTRHIAGANGNLEGNYLKGIQVGEQWLYTNPFIPAPMSDEEIAIATCMLHMERFITTGQPFYSLAEAAQDFEEVHFA